MRSVSVHLYEMATTEPRPDQIKNVTDHLRDTFADRVIRPTGVNEEIVQAFHAVDRGEFAPELYKGIAYQDKIVPLDDLATISQPSLVAKMIEYANINDGSEVLEIGTATGYQASVISQIAQSVDTIEIDPRLSALASSNIERLGYSGNISVHTGDGALGLEGKTFDAIIVTAGVIDIPDSYIEQLNPNGRIIAPIGNTLGGESLLTVVEKRGLNDISYHEMGPCVFVPLRTEQSIGWSNEQIQAKLRERFREWFQENESALGTLQNLLYNLRKKILDEEGEDANLPTENEMIDDLIEEVTKSQRRAEQE